MQEQYDGRLFSTKGLKPMKLSLFERFCLQFIKIETESDEGEVLSYKIFRGKIYLYAGTPLKVVSTIK